MATVTPEIKQVLRKSLKARADDLAHAEKGVLSRRYAAATKSIVSMNKQLCALVKKVESIEDAKARLRGRVNSTLEKRGFYIGRETGKIFCRHSVNRKNVFNLPDKELLLTAKCQAAPVLDLEALFDEIRQME